MKTFNSKYMNKYFLVHWSHGDIHDSKLNEQDCQRQFPVVAANHSTEHTIPLLYNP